MIAIWGFNNENLECVGFNLEDYEYIGKLKGIRRHALG